VCLAALATGATAAETSPAAGVKVAIKRLVSETKNLPRSAADRSTRRSLERLASEAKRESKADPCESSDLVTSLRKKLDGVSAKQESGRRPGPASPRGNLQTAAFAAEAALMQVPKTRKCGGGAAPGTESLEVDPAASDTEGVTLEVSLPRARWTPISGRGDDFTTLHMDGAESFGEVGDPGVPGFTDLIAVPVGADVSVEVTETDSYTIDAVEPFPKQEEAADGLTPPPASTFADRPFQINRPAFNANGTIPATVATGSPAGTFRDLAVGAVELAGAQFTPTKDKLEVFTRIEVRVRFGGANTGVWRTQKRTSVFERSFSRLYKSVLTNYPTVAADTGEDAEQGAAADETVLACGEDMLIVTSPALRPAADALADARRAAGLVVAVRETGTGEGQIGTTAAEIRDFIRAEITSTTCTRPTYAVLMGDAGHIPVFVEPCPSTTCVNLTATDNVATDLPYSLDGIGNDPFADVLLGRIPVGDLAAAQTVVGKIVGYETTSPAPPGDDFFNHATVTAFFQGAGPVDERTYTLAAETVRAGLRSRGHIVDRLYSASSQADVQQFSDGTSMPAEIKRPQETWDDDTPEMLEAWNDGRFLVMHRDHGFSGGWLHPNLTSFDIPQLTNGSQLPVAFGINCASGAFQNPNNLGFGPRLLSHPNGGAVGYFGDTDNSPTGPNTRLAIGFGDSLFPETVPGAGASEPLTRMGEVLNAGKIAMGQGAPGSAQLTGNTYFEHLLWHYLGDPSMQIWAATPTAFDPARITAAFEQPLKGASAPLDSGAFDVRVTMTQPGTDGTIATLRRNGTAIGRAVVQNGVAVITPEVRTDSDGLTVALERDGFLQRTVPVEAPHPEHTITCPPTISAANVTLQGQIGGGTFGQGFAGNGDPVRLRISTPTRTIERSITVGNNGQWQRIEPIAGDSGRWTVKAFYNEKGVADAVCQFVVP
jgi:hypothetical protein